MPGFDQDIPSIVAGYRRYVEGLRRDQDTDPVWAPEGDPDCDAYEQVQEVIRRGPEELAWRYILAILNAASDDDIATEAAGPLEELVRLRGSVLIGLIEEEARHDPRFRWALGQIWLTEGELPADILRRMVDASSGVIKVFSQSELKAAINRAAI